MHKLFIVFIIIFLFFDRLLIAQTFNQRAEQGDRLKIGNVFLQPVKFNPLIARTEYEQEINRLVFGEGLFSRAVDGHTTHGLASSYKQEHVKVWHIFLRSDIFFHDGSQITSEDVKFSFELYKKFALQSPQIFSTRLISAVEIINQQSLRIILKEPVRDFRETIGQLPILPKKYYQSWRIYNLLTSLPYIRPVGSGYFMLARYLPNSDIYLDVNRNHYKGRAFLNGIDFLFFETHDHLIDSFLQENIDLVAFQERSVWQKIYQITHSRDLITAERNDHKLYYINLNNRKAPFNEIDIRRALNYAINKNLLVEKILLNNGYAALNVLDINSEFFFEATKKYNYDPIRSLNILTSSGFRRRQNGKLFRGGEELKFDFFFEEGSVFEESITRLISINLRELGINILPRPMKPVEIALRLNEGNYQAALQSFVYDSENPEQTLREFYQFHLNKDNGFKNFSNFSINQLMEHSEKTYTRAKMQSISHRMQHLINQFSPCLFLFFEKRIYFVINNRFENIKKNFYQFDEFIVKISPKNEWYVPKNKQKY